MTRQDIIQAIEDYYGDSAANCTDGELLDALRDMERNGAVILWAIVAEII